VPLGAAVGILEEHGAAAFAAGMDSPAVVALVCVENLELGDLFRGDLSDSQAVLVDPTRRQGGVDSSTQTASHIGRHARSYRRIPSEVDVVLDAADLSSEQLKAEVNGRHVTGERITSGQPVIDVDLAIGLIEVLYLET
jgi:hypothetical protein